MRQRVGMPTWLTLCACVVVEGLTSSAPSVLRQSALDVASICAEAKVRAELFRMHGVLDRVVAALSSARVSSDPAYSLTIGGLMYAVAQDTSLAADGDLVAQLASGMLARLDSNEACDAGPRSQRRNTEVVGSPSGSEPAALQAAWARMCELCADKVVHNISCPVDFEEAALVVRRLCVLGLASCTRAAPEACRLLREHPNLHELPRIIRAAVAGPGRLRPAVDELVACLEVLEAASFPAEERTIQAAAVQPVDGQQGGSRPPTLSACLPGGRALDLMPVLRVGERAAAQLYWGDDERFKAMVAGARAPAKAASPIARRDAIQAERQRVAQESSPEHAMNGSSRPSSTRGAAQGSGKRAARSPVAMNSTSPQPRVAPDVFDFDCDSPAPAPAGRKGRGRGAAGTARADGRSASEVVDGRHQAAGGVDTRGIRVDKGGEHNRPPSALAPLQPSEDGLPRQLLGHALRALVNLTHGSRASCEKFVAHGVLLACRVVAAELDGCERRGGLAHHFDTALMTIGLLSNCLELCPDAAASIGKQLCYSSLATVGGGGSSTCSSSSDAAGSEACEGDVQLITLLSRTLRTLLAPLPQLDGTEKEEALEKQAMEREVFAAYVSLLVGFLCRRHGPHAKAALHALEDTSFRRVATLLQSFLELQSEARLISRESATTMAEIVAFLARSTPS